MTVARNLVIDEARIARRRHEATVAELPERARPDDSDALFDALLIEGALAALSPDHRTVIVAAYYGGGRTTQAAGELGIPEGTPTSRGPFCLGLPRPPQPGKGVVSRNPPHDAFGKWERRFF